MTLEFQIYDWSEDHEEELLDTDSDNSEENNINLVYIIHSFGRTLDGKSVYMKITDYHPYFYIKLPEKWTLDNAKKKVKIMKEYLTSKKNYKVWHVHRNSLLKIIVCEKKSAEGFTNGKKYLFAKVVFSTKSSMSSFKKLFELNKLFINNVTKKDYRYKTFEANLLPMLRCFHNIGIGGCSWVSVNKYNEVKGVGKESYCDIEINVNYRKIIPIKKDINAPLRILSFDIECNSKSGNFPMAKKKEDPIIQIGSTYTYLGESIPYRQHIVCLKDTSKLKGIVVKTCKTERDLILAWKKEIIKYDCDIITGYNIFWFDEAYIRDRCKIHLDLEEEILTISKLKNKVCNYKNFKLASSAMGENKIKMFNTPGRVHIDLMKDVQKTYNLSSYKLDSVASNFIRDKIIKIEKTNSGYKLFCSGIDDIFVEDFIHIELVYDFISDYIGDKYTVTEIDIDNKILFVTGNTELDNYLDSTDNNISLWWSQAKDDVGPKDIFNYWMNGSDDDRATVAKYCVKDCRLVNLLVNKLEVVTKNIEMSNVCYVPLSFLFIRGQGIKGFSLCSKVYQDEGFVFPVIYRNIKFRDGTSDVSSITDGEIIYSKSKFNSDGEILDEPETLNIKVKRTVNNKKIVKIIERKSDKIKIEPSEGYEGAIVFEPEPTVEYEALAVKDYASLYPSSIIQKNMSHETKVINDDYDNIPGIKYYNAQFKDKNGVIQYKRFAKCNDELGVIPKTLAKLLSERKLVKKQMKKETDIFKKKILDAKQLALKITANSLYGCMGASISAVKDKDIAACCTSTGREMLIFAKKYDEEIVPSIINGLKHAYKTNDTVTEQKILDKEYPSRPKDFQSNIKKFITEKLCNIAFQPIIRYGDTDSVFTCYRFKNNIKELNDVNSLDIWKKMINFSETLISFFIPIEYKSLWEELHQKYYKTNSIKTLSLPNITNIPKNSNNNKILLSIEDRMKIFLRTYMEESFLPWLWILQEIYSKKIVEDKKFDDMVNSYKEKMIPTKNKLTKILETIQELEQNKELDEQKAIQEKTTKKYIRELKSKYTKEIRILKKEFKILQEEYKKLEKAYNLLKPEVDFTDVINNRLYNHGSMLIETMCLYTDEITQETKNKIDRIIKKFMCTVMGNIIVQPYYTINKDNVYTVNCKFYENGKIMTDNTALENTITMGIFTGELVKSRLPYPQDLEYEKTYYPFLILTKKRYVGNKYEFDFNKFKQDFMGIVLKRRDNAPIVKEICNGIINCLINEKKPDKAGEYLKNCLKNMIENKYDIKYFLISKTLKMKNSYVDWTRIAHMVLADRISKRDVGNAPQSGDRISYAAIKIDNLTKQTLQGERIETPEYIKEKNLQIDYNFYITNQIMKPALQFLELVIPNADKIFEDFIKENKLF